MSLAIEPKDRATTAQFSKVGACFRKGFAVVLLMILGQALNKFTKEDPTFRVGYDNETKQTIIR
jgi:hypothetical protein